MLEAAKDQARLRTISLAAYIRLLIQADLEAVNAEKLKNDTHHAGE